MTGVAYSRRIQPRGPWVRGRGFTHPGSAEYSQLEHCSPTAYEGCGGAGGSSPVHAAMVPGVVLPPGYAVEQGARVGRTPGAEDHAGDDHRKGRGAGTQPAQRAAQRLHPGLDDAKQGMEDEGGRRRGLQGPAGGSGRCRRTPGTTRAAGPPQRRRDAQRLPGATCRAARGPTRRQAPVPRGTTEADGVQPLRAQSVLSGTSGCRGGIPEEVADDAGHSAHLGWGGVGQQGHHQSPERARAADLLGEVEGESVPPRSATRRPWRVGRRSLGRPHRRRRREHGRVRGGVLSRGPRRGLGGALGREGGWRRECREWWRHRHWDRRLPPHLGLRRRWPHLRFHLGGLFLLGQGGEEGAVGTVRP